MNFDFSLPSIMTMLIFSGLGMVYFSYGKKQTNFKLVFCGIGLMVYSYFTPNLYWDIGVGIALAGLPFLLDRL